MSERSRHSSAPAGKEDVLVVGAGPTGLLLSGELARRGIGCRLGRKTTPVVQPSRSRR